MIPSKGIPSKGIPHGKKPVPVQQPVEAVEKPKRTRKAKEKDDASE